MRPGSARWILLGVLAVAPRGASGQQPTPTPRDLLCGRVLLARFHTAAQSNDPCFELAGAVVIEVTDALYRGVDLDSAISPRDLQQTNSGDAVGGGSLAQDEAVPTVQPMAIGGGSVAAVGSDAGANAITALTLNPSIFFAPPGDREKTARLSRLADLTVLFPVDQLDRDHDGRVDYFGARLRMNVTGAGAGGRVMQKARDLFTGLLRKEAENATRLAQAFKSAPNLETCVAALLGPGADAGAITSACGEGARVQVDAAQYAQFQRQLAAAREEADAKYLGLDVRLDFGDPTLGAVANAAATALTGGLAFGRQFVAPDADAASLGLKGRLGVRYTDLRNVDETSFALDGGLGLHARRPLEDGSAVDLAGGFEFRYARARGLRSALQTDYLMFRASLAVPLAGGTRVAIALGAPLIGQAISPTLSISANWGLLLPRVAPP